MGSYITIAFFYFAFQLIVNGLIPTVQFVTESNDTSNYEPQHELIQQYYDFFIIMGILITFRSRKWPEYFTVGLFDGEATDFDGQLDDMMDKYKIIPFSEAIIDQRMLNSQNGYEYSIGGNQSFFSDE